ncbi:2-desacetyl-2-hydroxyethyl bacteriochlorophyllide A dehydrogenase [Paenibacillus shirakamiensis]|uniref:2-desacetyl-2-hydroxyethyl bacteriochlorophyllide A dehydrogenase n=1 Tax=Paenibacillus shirakamiensis TaxID=1265935 RepID=A0ABS4JE01_9BACL|nr:zinc-binding alcohol dehydrogenase [Paenibacillus shirakamiensis]MBP1999952.1 2-desacetyl-2-hydroxyethyl bacteriochlorophyllide A dehydrogenase [Paenibacillus shirakamiensis]
MPDIAAALTITSLNCVFQEPDRIELIEECVPDPGAGQILCAAQKSLISTGTELACLKGRFDEGTVWSSWVRYPFYPGYSMAAQVLKIGSGVEGIKAGDRIICPAGHRQYFLVDAEESALIPEWISDEEAIFTQIAKVALLGVLRAEHAFGERVGVIGLGLIGQLVIQYLNRGGARQIIAIAPSTFRLDQAHKNGATDLLNLPVSQAFEQVEELTGGRMLDTVYDVTGSYDVLPYCTQLTRDLGKVILLGDSTEPSKQTIGPNVVFNSVSLLGIHGRMMEGFKGWTEADMNKFIFESFHRGKLDVASLVTEKVSPLEAVSVYARLAEHKSDFLGVIFDWSQL